MAVAAGTATITVTSADGSKTATCTVSTITPTSTAYTVGAVGQTTGGYVFYDAGNYSTYGWRYLECVPSDQSTGVQWYNGTASLISGAAGTAIGTGKANTTAIVAAQGTSVSYAARLCKELSLDGYSDWFLPSKDELNLMYTNLKVAGFGSFADYYWSSSQDYSGNAWSQSFRSGYQNTSYFTVSTGYVRAIRAF